MEESSVKDSLAVFRTSQAFEVRATVVRLSRFSATFEIYSLDTVIQTSEVLEDFKIFTHERVVYSGRCVVRECVNTGTFSLCTVSLDDANFDADFFVDLGQKGRLCERFE